MPARDWTGRIVCDVCPAYRGDASSRMPTWSEVRQQLEHCQSVIEQTLSRMTARDTEVIADDDLYRFGPQGAD
jgi:hypothetical protein